MKLNRLVLNGFKCFNEEQIFYFGKDKGLYSLVGKNNVDKKLGSNGSGKSTIWDALCWVLYGKTVRGVKAGDLSTWFDDKEKTFKVKLEWENDDKEYTLFRQWSPNKLVLTINGKSTEVEQYRVDEVFGLPYKPFLFSVVMGQSRPMFFDLREANKSILFSEVFDLDKWENLSDKALKDSKELGILYYNILNAIDKNIIKQGLLWDRLNKEENLNDQWNKSNGSKKDRINFKIERIKKEIKELKIKIKKVSLEKEKIIKSTELISEEIKVLGKSLMGTENRLEESKDNMAMHKSQINIKKEDEKYFRKYIKEGKCPCTLCGQNISPKYAASQVRGIKSKIVTLGKKYSDSILEKKRWNKKLAIMKEKIYSLEKEGRQISYNLGTINSDVEYLNKEIKNSFKEIEYLEEDYLDIENESNPFLSSIKKINSDLFYLIGQRSKLKRISNMVMDKKEQTFFWAKGFKDIRLYMVSEFLTQLEIEVNNALGKLGLPDWKISFDIEKETKSKTVKKGFHVFIHSPLNKNPVPWESWSGGESQRLRVAGNMGLSNLILSQYGINPNIEIWDEPSSHLGKEGLGDLLDTLQDRSQLLNKCLWVVEHNSLEFGDFVKKTTIIKTKKGSIINNWRLK